MKEKRKEMSTTMPKRQSQNLISVRNKP